MKMINVRDDYTDISAKGKSLPVSASYAFDVYCSITIYPLLSFPVLTARLATLVDMGVTTWSLDPQNI